MFSLQFSPSEIRDRSALYRWHDLEEAALVAGDKIRAGDLDKANLEPIFEWKVRERRKALRAINTQADVEDALSLAMAAKTVRSALTVLTGLAGVRVPVASAILTAIMPERYTVIDFRALAALGVELEVFQYDRVSVYEPYLRHCLSASAGYGVTLRQYDRALWQWSEAVGTKRAEKRIPNSSTNLVIGMF